MTLYCSPYICVDFVVAQVPWYQCSWPWWLKLSLPIAFWYVSLSCPYEMLLHTGAILIVHFVTLLCNSGRMTPEGHMLRLWHSWEVGLEPVGGGTAGVFPEGVVRLWLLSLLLLAPRKCLPLPCLLLWGVALPQTQNYRLISKTEPELTCFRKIFILTFEIYIYLISPSPFLSPSPPMYPSLLSLKHIASFSLMGITHIFLNTIL